MGGREEERKEGTGMEEVMGSEEVKGDMGRVEEEAEAEGVEREE